jgi:hypothetical protein
MTENRNREAAAAVAFRSYNKEVVAKADEVVLTQGETVWTFELDEDTWALDGQPVTDPKMINTLDSYANVPA